MAFEQQHIEELEQLQKQRENERIQQELDLAIARIENEQIQRDLDAAIERLDQQISQHEENTEEKVIDDKMSQQSSSTEEELSSHESVTEQKSDQQNSLEQSIRTWDDELISQHEEDNKEQQTQYQKLTETEDSIQEEEVIERDQEVELNLLQMREKNSQFQQDLDAIIERLDQVSQPLLSAEKVTSSHDSVTEGTLEQLYSLEQSHQSSDDQSNNHHEEEQRTLNLDIKKTENSIHEGQETTRNQNLEHDWLQKIENKKQFQKDLDAIITRLDQASPQPLSAEKETSYHKSGKQEQLNPFEKSHQINQNSIKEKIESKMEKEEKKHYSKPLEETITEQEAFHKELKPNKEIYVIEKDVDRKRHTIIQTEHEAIKTGKYSDLKSLARAWNEYIAKGGRPTVEMWKTYNKIQEKYDKPIVLYKENDNLNAYKISICGELYSQLDSKLFNKRLSNPAKQISKLLDYWLIQAGKKEGIKPFFEVTVKNPSTKEMETYWIANAKQRNWNPYEAKEQRFFSGHRAAGGMITKFLTTKIKLNEEHIELYPRIEKSLRKKYPKLGVQTGRRNLKGQKILFRTFYKLNYPKEVTDEAIKLMFWKYVDSRPKSYIRSFSRKISRLITYYNENNIVPRKNIMQTKIFVPNSYPFISNNDLGNKLQNAMSKISISDRDNELKNSPKKKVESITNDKKAHITSRPIVKNLLTTLQKIEENFGLNDLSPTYKPPINLILNYDNSNENKLIIKAESVNDKDLAHFLLEGFGLSSKAKVEKGAFWFGKIIYPMKGKSKNEWHRFTKFISSRSERKIENHDKWYSSKHAGSAKTIRRRVLVEIALNALKGVKAELMENAIILANDSKHRKWVNHSRADARRNKNPETALQRLEENILWWNKFLTNTPIDSENQKKEKIVKSEISKLTDELGGNKIQTNTTTISENYQTQALLYIMNTKKSAIECLTRVFEKGKITNIEFSKIADEIDEISPRIKVTDAKTGKIVILNDVLPVEEGNRLGRKRVAFDVFHENLGANIAFKAHLEFFNRYNPSQSPLVNYLGLNPDELKNCKIELQWSDRNGYPSTGISMTDTFAPDIVVRNNSGQIIAVIQLKGYSQTRTSIQPNASVFQVLELKKYDKNPRIKTALVNVNQKEDFIIYEWLVLEKQKNFQQKQLIGEITDKISELGWGYEKHPNLDPLIPKNLRKRAFLEDIYDKIIDCKSTYDISKVFSQIKETILTSERNFYRFIGHKEENIITEKIIQNYLITLQDKLQMVVNKVDKPNGINSCPQFRYYWAKEVVLDYYERIREYLGHFRAIDR